MRIVHVSSAHDTSKTDAMILVTTPTGDIGHRVLERVLDAGERVRVIARDPTRLPDALRRRVEAIEGSHADPGAMGRALEGVTRVFWLPPGNPDSADARAAYVGFSQALCDALPGSDVTHVVGVSALGRGWTKPAGLAEASVAMDDAIGATGTSYRALSCASLMDNLLRQAVPLREDGVFYQPTPGHLKLPHVAKADVAAVAVRLLLSPDWDGVEEVPLHGPEDLSFDEMAAIASDVLDRPIRCREMPMDAFESMLRANGTSEGMARDYVRMLVAKNEGMDTMAGPRRREETPTTFRRWAETELRPAVAGTSASRARDDGTANDGTRPASSR